MSARLARVLSPCTAAPGEVSGRFVPRGDGAKTGDWPLRPNGARVTGGGMGRVQEEEAEDKEGAEERGAGAGSAADDSGGGSIGLGDSISLSYDARGLS